MLISFTDPVILKTTPDSKMVNSWHATKMPYYNKSIGDIACQLQAYVCPMLFFFVFVFFRFVPVYVRLDFRRLPGLEQWLVIKPRCMFEMFDC